MKKIITILLAVCTTACLIAAPASAAGIKISWPDWQSIYDWFCHLPAESEETEPPAESVEPEEPEEPEETAPAEEYTIRYDANGGYFWSQYASPAISSIKKYTVTAGGTHKIISAPQRTCYTFAGWMDEDGNLYQPGDKITPTGDLSLKAKWTYNG